ncbi:MAG: hypothetical protein R2932_16145 [Caldilineaceae bacterium]
MQPGLAKDPGRRSLLEAGQILLVYQEEGGLLILMDGTEIPRPYRIVDPTDGEVVSRVRDGGDHVGAKSRREVISAEGGVPRVYLFFDEGQ